MALFDIETDINNKVVKITPAIPTENPKVVFGIMYNVRKTKINPIQIFVATTINLLRALNILFLKR
jgi:hypothetical protein